MEQDMSMIPLVASVEQADSAVRYAERRPAARWYVAKRLRAIGAADKIPAAWGLTADAGWNPRLHPRDRVGKFIEVNDLVNIFSMAGSTTPTGRGRVTGNGEDGHGEFVEVQIEGKPDTIRVSTDKVQAAPEARARIGDEPRVDPEAAGKDVSTLRAEDRAAEAQSKANQAEAIAKGEMSVEEAERKHGRDSWQARDARERAGTPSAKDRLEAGPKANQGELPPSQTEQNLSVPKPPKPRKGAHLYAVDLPDGGKAYRQSPRDYTHAVAVKHGDKDEWGVISFSGSEKNASRTMGTWRNKLPGSDFKIIPVTREREAVEDTGKIGDPDKPAPPAKIKKSRATEADLPPGGLRTGSDDERINEGVPPQVVKLGDEVVGYLARGKSGYSELSDSGNYRTGRWISEGSGTMIFDADGQLIKVDKYGADRPDGVRFGTLWNSSGDAMSYLVDQHAAGNTPAQRSRAVSERLAARKAEREAAAKAEMPEAPTDEQIQQAGEVNEFAGHLGEVTREEQAAKARISEAQSAQQAYVQGLSDDELDAAIQTHPGSMTFLAEKSRREEVARTERPATIMNEPDRPVDVRAALQAKSSDELRIMANDGNLRELDRAQARTELNRRMGSTPAAREATDYVRGLSDDELMAASDRQLSTRVRAALEDEIDRRGLGEQPSGGAGEMSRDDWWNGYYDTLSEAGRDPSEFDPPQEAEGVFDRNPAEVAREAIASKDEGEPVPDGETPGIPDSEKSSGFQVGLTDAEGNPVSDPVTAAEVLNKMYPGLNATADDIEEDDANFGSWLVPLPNDAVRKAIEQDNGGILVQADGYELDAEIPGDVGDYGLGQADEESNALGEDQPESDTAYDAREYLGMFDEGVEDPANMVDELYDMARDLDAEGNTTLAVQIREAAQAGTRQRDAQIERDEEKTGIRPGPEGEFDTDRGPIGVTDEQWLDRTGERGTTLTQEAQDSLDQLRGLRTEAIKGLSKADLEEFDTALFEDWRESEDTIPERLRMAMQDVAEAANSEDEMPQLMAIVQALGQERWSIQEQLDAVLDGQSMEEQNPNALSQLQEDLRPFGDRAGVNILDEAFEAYLTGESADEMGAQYPQAELPLDDADIPEAPTTLEQDVAARPRVDSIAEAVNSWWNEDEFTDPETHVDLLMARLPEEYNTPKSREIAQEWFETDTAQDTDRLIQSIEEGELLPEEDQFGGEGSRGPALPGDQPGDVTAPDAQADIQAIRDAALERLPGWTERGTVSDFMVERALNDLQSDRTIRPDSPLAGPLGRLDDPDFRRDVIDAILDRPLPEWTPTGEADLSQVPDDELTRMGNRTPAGPGLDRIHEEMRRRDIGEGAQRAIQRGTPGVSVDEQNRSLAEREARIRKDLARSQSVAESDRFREDLGGSFAGVSDSSLKYKLAKARRSGDDAEVQRIRDEILRRKGPLGEMRDAQLRSQLAVAMQVGDSANEAKLRAEIDRRKGGAGKA